MSALAPQARARDLVFGWSLAHLQDECAARGLDSEGRRAELACRLAHEVCASDATAHEFLAAAEYGEEAVNG